MKKTAIFALGAIAVLSLGACKPAGVDSKVAQQRAIAIQEELKTRELPKTMSITSNMDVVSKSGGAKEAGSIKQTATFTAENSYYHTTMESQGEKMELGTFIKDGQFYFVNFDEKSYMVTEQPVMPLAPFEDIKQFVTQAVDELVLFTKEDAKAVETILNEQLKGLDITVDVSNSDGEFSFYSDSEFDLLAELSLNSSMTVNGMALKIAGDVTIDIKDCLIVSQTSDVSETLTMQGESIEMAVSGKTTYKYNVPAEPLPDLTNFAKAS